jgi:hypothetical protein
LRDGGLERLNTVADEQKPTDGAGKKDEGGNGGDERGPAPTLLGRQRLRLISHRRQRWRLRLSRLADFQRIDVDRLGDVLELGLAEIGDLEIEPPLHLPIGLLRETDRAGLGEAFEPSGDIDPVAHQVAVGLLDDIAEMDADAELYAALGRHAGVALGHAVLHLDCAAHSVDHAAKLNEAAVPGALDDAAMMRRDRGVDQVAPKPPEPRQRAIFIRSGEAAVADHVGDQNRRDFPGLAHGAPSWSRHISPNASLGLPV